MADGKDNTENIETFIGGELHGLMFLEEFVFPSSKFLKPNKSEVEFADAVVVLGDVLLVCQIKERQFKSIGNADIERRWFERTVMKKATKQIRDTISYLNDFNDILVPNARGRVFNVAANCYKDVIKIVLYRSDASLPDDCRTVRCHISSTAGLIHILDAAAYLEIFRTLRVPAEVVHYFAYRERLLANYNDACGRLSEAAIVGHFIGGAENELPTMSSVRFLRGLKQDTESWDIAPILRSLRTHLGGPGTEDDYYPILLEFAKLRRAYWRAVYERIRLSFEAVRRDEYTLPFRFCVGKVGFVFVPVHSEIGNSPEWSGGGNVRLLLSYMAAHKYDQHLTRCVGYEIAKDGDSFLVTWAFTDFEWTPDPQIEVALSENFPFRPVKEERPLGFIFDE